MDAPFLGFPDTQAFLRDLEAHNDRTWFNANKARYERAYKEPAEAFMAELRPRVAKLVERPVAARVFRIHRDTRFSKDKTPYHTYLRISFHPEISPGEPRRRGGFFFGLVASQVVVGVGAFDFGPEDLDRYRRAIADDASGGELADILARLGTGQIHEPALKRVPAPYPADHPRGELLRRQELNGFRDLDDPALVGSPELADWAMAQFEELDAVNVWLTEALAT
jgi:uncharacterized protein (TIGR02453 family)